MQKSAEQGTRAVALARLAAFVPHAWAAYDRGRNFADGTDATSHLSPYLQRRLVDPEEVIEAVLRAAPHAKAVQDGGKYLQEVVWRTYWKGWLAHHPQVWRRYVSEVKQLMEVGGGLAAACDQARRGATGIVCFDAWAHELVQTGYLHNHARMWFASIWIHTLRLPWQVGAAFFMRYLLDGDAASNTLSWRWVAGLQTRGKAYLATSENIAKYTQGRFAATPNLATAPALLAELHEAPAERPVGVPFESFVRPPVSDPLGLIVTLDDMAVETTAVGDCNIRCVVIVTGAWTRSVCERSATVDAFDASAVADAYARCVACYGCPVMVLHPAAQMSGAVELGQSLKEVAQAHDVQHWLLARPQIGPVNDVLGADAMRAACTKISCFTRPHDLELFPAATRGFFHLKKRLPKYLEKVQQRMRQDDATPERRKT